MNEIFIFGIIIILPWLGYIYGNKLGRRAYRREIMERVEDHYWDSLEDDRDLIIRHMEKILKFR